MKPSVAAAESPAATDAAWAAAARARLLAADSNVVGAQ